MIADGTNREMESDIEYEIIEKSYDSLIRCIARY